MNNFQSNLTRYRQGNGSDQRMTSWSQVASFVTGTPSRDDTSVSRSLALWTEGMVEIQEKHDGVLLYRGSDAINSGYNTVHLQYPISRLVFDAHLDALTNA
jgi:hypothetical protein